LLGRNFATMDDAKLLTLQEGVYDIGREHMLCSQDSKMFFTTSRNLVLVFAVETGALLKKLAGHSQRVRGICLCRKNPYHLYSCGNDGRVILWDVLQGKELKTIVHVEDCWITNIACGKKALLAHYVQPKTSTRLVKITLGKKQKEVVVYNTSKKVQCMMVDSRGTSWAVTAERQLTLSRRGKTEFLKLPAKGTSIAFHPTKDKLAVGLQNGEILVFNHFDKNLLNPSSYHWHNHAVQILHFTNDGRVISGGEEGVIVLWHLATSHRQHIARLGSHIRSFAVTPNETSYIIGLGSNEITLMDSIQETKRLTVEGIGMWRFTLGKCKEWNFNSRPCVDPATNTIAIQKNKQEIQFYDFPRDRCLGSLSIQDGRNRVSRRDADHLNSAVVQCFGLSVEGGWLATTELFTVKSILGQPHVDVTLKVWKRNMNLNRVEFILNTDIRSPHKDSVIKFIRFRPNSSEFVTCTDSGEFGIWSCVENKWRCRNIGDYRGQQIQDVDYSPEGSLLVITFSNAITVWESESVNLLRELHQPKPLRKVRFTTPKNGIPKLLTFSQDGKLSMHDLRSLQPPKAISNVLDFSVLGTKVGVLLEEELLVYDSGTFDDFKRKYAEQRWKIPNLKPLPGHFLLHRCGGNDFGVTIITETRTIWSREYLTATWNGEVQPSASAQTVFQQLYAPTELQQQEQPQQQERKRKRQADDIEQRKRIKIDDSLVPPIFKNASYSLPSLMFLLKTLTEPTEASIADYEIAASKEESDRATATDAKQQKQSVKMKKMRWDKLLDSKCFRKYKPRTLDTFNFDLVAS